MPLLCARRCVCNATKAAGPVSTFDVKPSTVKSWGKALQGDAKDRVEDVDADADANEIATSEEASEKKEP